MFVNHYNLLRPSLAPSYNRAKCVCLQRFQVPHFVFSTVWDRLVRRKSIDLPFSNADTSERFWLTSGHESGPDADNRSQLMIVRLSFLQVNTLRLFQSRASSKPDSSMWASSATQPFDLFLTYAMAISSANRCCSPVDLISTSIQQV